MNTKTIRQKLQPFFGKEVRMLVEGTPNPIQFFDWQGLLPEDQRSLCFTYLHRINGSMGGDGEKIVIDRRYLPIALQGLDEKPGGSKVCLLVEIKSGKIFMCKNGVSESLISLELDLERFLQRMSTFSSKNNPITFSGSET